MRARTSVSNAWRRVWVCSAARCASLWRNRPSRVMRACSFSR
ncbi:Uncharacterised protein [Bordetella pertussis]|nr:Uncharacterised protein [Bordetella pertussis]